MIVTGSLALVGNSRELHIEIPMVCADDGLVHRALHIVARFEVAPLRVCVVDELRWLNAELARCFR